MSLCNFDFFFKENGKNIKNSRKMHFILVNAQKILPFKTNL